MVLIGAPLFLAIGIATLACVTLIQDISAFNISKDMYEAVKKEELLAIPFFVLAGNIMTQGTIAERLVRVARAFMGMTPGGLGLASILACVIFAAISGSSPVAVIAVGSIMFPMLVKDRYPKNYSMGVLTSAGSLGIIIPPSVPMIIYAIMVGQTLVSSSKEEFIQEGLRIGGLEESVLQVSPNDLFIAGVLPGLFIASVLALYTLYQLRPTRKDIEIVPNKMEGGYFNNLFKEISNSFFAILLPVIILGGIYGILGPLKFTVTEAAAVAVVYALFVEFVIHRELKLKKLPKVLSDSGVMMGSLFLIIVLAIAFNKFLAEQSIPQYAAQEIQNIVSNKWQFLILVNIFLLLLGCVMDIISAILIVAPLLAPIAMSYGIHPLHFGIMFIVNLELGYLTPPLGINLFVASTVFKRPIMDIMKATLPFLFLMIFCLIVIVYFPFLSLALL
jgi:C4-dicarboxylate transporter DctM subunit